jgi:hypothetical protein
MYSEVKRETDKLHVRYHFFRDTLADVDTDHRLPGSPLGLVAHTLHAFGRTDARPWLTNSDRWGGCCSDMNRRRGQP